MSIILPANTPENGPKPINTGTLTFLSNDNKKFSAYVAAPQAASKTSPVPVILVLQEIFGVNADMQQKCDALAGEGYMAICPDLFWRLEANVTLTDKSEAEWSKAFDLLNKFDVDQGIIDLAAVLQQSRTLDLSNGVVGCIGYCLGGKLAYLMASRTDIDVSVGYYGIGLEFLLQESTYIKKPLMLHIAEEDKFVSKEAQATIRAALEKNNNIALHAYANVNHAFARINGEHYDAAAATFANKRTRSFLSAYLLNRTQHE